MKTRNAQIFLHHNSKGMATLETLPLIVIFVIMMTYGMGFFGIIHSAILNSIAARSYAFETFRNRSDVTFFRDLTRALEDPNHFQKKEVRLHLIIHEGKTNNLQYATARPLSPVGDNSLKAQRRPGSTDLHMRQIYSLESRNRRVEVNPAWIMVGYGICLNANCGD